MQRQTEYQCKTALKGAVFTSINKHKYLKENKIEDDFLTYLLNYLEFLDNVSIALRSF